MYILSVVSYITPKRRW